jgi:hypothetical protein
MKVVNIPERKRILKTKVFQDLAGSASTEDAGAAWQPA